MGASLLLKMIRAVQFFLLCVVFKDINADPRPNPLDTVNVHLHLGDLEEAVAAKEKEGQDYGYHPCAAPPCSVDNGDSINTGDNCKDVICTGKGSAINIKCCGNDYAAKKEGEKGSDYSNADSAKPEAEDSPKSLKMELMLNPKMELMLSQKMELMPNLKVEPKRSQKVEQKRSQKMELKQNPRVVLNRNLKMALKKSLKVLEVLARKDQIMDITPVLYHPVRDMMMEIQSTQEIIALA